MRINRHRSSSSLPSDQTTTALFTPKIGSANHASRGGGRNNWAEAVDIKAIIHLHPLKMSISPIILLVKDPIEVPHLPHVKSAITLATL